MLWSLLGVWHCIWSAQFIENWVDFHPLMLNRVLQRIPSKLESSGWLWAQLTTQEHPYHQGDAICSFNLNHYCCLQWFRIFTFYRVFSFDFSVDFLLPREKRVGSWRLDLVFIRHNRVLNAVHKRWVYKERSNKLRDPLSFLMRQSGGSISFLLPRDLPQLEISV